MAADEFPKHHPLVVVDNSASKMSNCVVVIVLLLVSRNSKPTKTILLEFIFYLLVDNTFFSRIL